MRERILNISIVVLTVCAVITTGLVIRKELFPSTQHTASSAAAQAARTVDDWRQLSDVRAKHGKEDAGIVIVEFSDFSCPYCAQMVSPLQQLTQKYPDQIAVVYRHLPRPGSSYSYRAAVAAECGSRQNMFMQVRETIFENLRNASDRSFDYLANFLGMPDPTAFENCLNDADISKVIDEDVAAAASAGISATPTLVVNDRVLVGARTFAQLDSFVMAAMK